MPRVPPAFAVAGLLALVSTLARPAGMDADPEARALLQTFRNTKATGVCLEDSLDGVTTGTPTGPVGFGPGLKHDRIPRTHRVREDRAALFPEDRTEAIYLYYGPYVPRRGHFQADFRLDKLPRDHTMMTLFSIGTGGNTCMYLRVGLDLRVSATSLTRRESITLVSEPVALGKWRHVEYWYGPEGSLLLLDGVVEDFTTDWSVPYAHDLSNAFYLGDQPWWDGKAVFYPLDSFVGLIDNVKLARLETGGTK